MGSTEPSRALNAVLLMGASAYGVFHLYFATIDTIQESWRNAVHVGGALAFAFVFASLRFRPGVLRLAFVLLAILSLALPAYVIGTEEALFARNERLLTIDLVMAGAVMAVVLFGVGVAGGWVLTVLGALSVAYALWLGALLPGTLGFRGISYYTFSYRMLWGGEGYLGFLTSISATYVYLFILFGTMLLAAGSGRFLVQLSLRLGNRVPGGPAQAAVIASAMMGSVTGTSIGNVMATGSVTIPMMLRAGYRPSFAAGVEASASNIGQIAPPVMGAGAFILAAWTQTPYGTVVLLAILPAALYFYSVFLGVVLYARRENFRAEVETEPVVWRDGIPFALGIGTLIAALVVGYTPVYACVLGIVGTLSASWLTRDHRIGPIGLATVFLDTARTAAITALMLAAANVVVGMLTLTGKAITFSAALVDAAGGNVYLMVAAVALISLILGMGLPITASYVIVAAVVGSGFEEFGFTLLAVHLMIFWYSQDSNVTPPIALSAFAAAGIAKTAPFPAAIEAWRLSKGLYAIPLLFLSGDLLFENGALAAATAFAAAVVGLTGLAIALARHGYRGPIPMVLGLPLFATSVGCFLLDRDVANGFALATLALLGIGELVGRSRAAPAASPP
ncbi:TRAP transporter permease [Acuticoccus sp.]|uniref:TRAP transporter permease n=1 Tax=Acuticoccus sp. TaxID=1904378 RepID=UPI003B52C610